MLLVFMKGGLRMATSWKFKLNVNNHTDREFKVTSKNLNWGYWDLEDVEDKEPIDIKPNTNAQVLGIKAARGTWTGYQCDCTWTDTTEESSYGTIYLEIDVPFSADNSSKLDVSGDIKISGWEELPEDGHKFSRSIDIFMVDGKIQISSENDEDEKAYRVYLKQRNNFNQMIRKWEELEKINAVEYIPVTEIIPVSYIYPPNVILRSEATVIPKELWDGFGDPLYETEYQKFKNVDEYFSVGIYTLNTDTRSIQTIAAGVNTVKETSVEVTSFIKDTLTHNTSIKATLEASISKAESASLAAELESQYSISDVHEESSNRVNRETVTYTIKESDKNRIFVQWLLMEAVAIYRKKKNGEVGLVAISEWPLQVLDKVYEY